MKNPLSNVSFLFAVPAILYAFGSIAHASDISSQDKMFAQKAAVGGMFEVQSSQVALTKDSNPDVQNFAKMMVRDHSKANDKLKSIAASKNLTLPDGLDAKHQKMLDTLKSESGKDFQNDYLADMTKGHAAADALFSNEASAGSDPDIKAFAMKTDKVIKHHIAALDELKTKV